jgi:hypothetical protein
MFVENICCELKWNRSTALQQHKKLVRTAWMGWPLITTKAKLQAPAVGSSHSWLIHDTAHQTHQIS